MGWSIWIACYDCGDMVQVPEADRYTKPLCDGCKAERRARYMASISKPPRRQPPAETLTEAIDQMIAQGVVRVDSGGNCYARLIDEPTADPILVRGVVYKKHTEE